MSNRDLAKVIFAGMWQLACMVIWYTNGDRSRGEACEQEFMKLFNTLNEDA